MNKRTVATLSKLFLHVIIWLTFYWLSIGFFLNWLPSLGAHVSLAYIIQYCTFYILILMIVPYLNFFILLPKFYFKRKYWIYFTLLIAAMSVVSFGKMFLDAYYSPIEIPWLMTIGHFFNIMPYMLFFIILLTWVKYSNEWSKKLKQEEELKKAKTEAELKWLKAQINPHFFFNVLNNIHSLIHFKSDEAGPTLVRLSEFLRYMTYDCNHDKIPMGMEVTQLKNYIQLQLFKKKRREKITLDMVVEAPDAMIEPLILLNFVENAFKHSNIDAEQGFIQINLKASDHLLDFTVLNTYDDFTFNHKESGIGLENIKRRLELVYPGKYSLKIQNKDYKYHVQLMIKLIDVA